nr:uncharacterized protein LOC115132581 [Oncorhynchus nerka]
MRFGSHGFIRARKEQCNSEKENKLYSTRYTEDHLWKRRPGQTINSSSSLLQYFTLRTPHLLYQYNVSSGTLYTGPAGLHHRTECFNNSFFHSYNRCFCSYNHWFCSYKRWSCCSYKRWSCCSYKRWSCCSYKRWSCCSYKRWSCCSYKRWSCCSYKRWSCCSYNRSSCCSYKRWSCCSYNRSSCCSYNSSNCPIFQTKWQPSNRSVSVVFCGDSSALQPVVLSGEPPLAWILYCSGLYRLSGYE